MLSQKEILVQWILDNGGRHRCICSLLLYPEEEKNSETSAQTARTKSFLWEAAKKCALLD